MGRNQVTLTVTAALSSHNSEQDDIDQQRWERFVRQVRDIAERPEYDDINIMVFEG